MFRNKLQVLVIDDDPDFLNLFQIYIRKYHQEISIIPLLNPKEILTRLESMIPDVIVCDYEMPFLSGLDVLNLLLNNKYRIPFILCTAKDLDELRTTYYTSKMTFCIKKAIPIESTFRLLTQYIQSCQVRK